MAKQYRPKVQKAVFEVRFKPDFTVIDRIFPAAKKLKSYTNWETDKLSIIVSNIDNRCSVKISSNNFAYIQDAENRELEAQNISEIIDVLPKALNVSAFTRCGYRCKYLIPVKVPFQRLTEICDVKWVSQNKRYRSFLPGSMVDIGVRYNLKDDDYFYHLHFGPVKKTELPDLLQFDKKHHLANESADLEYVKILTDYPDIALYADIDIFQVGKLDQSSILDFVSNAREKSNELISNYIDYTLEQG